MEDLYHRFGHTLHIVVQTYVLLTISDSAIELQMSNLQQCWGILVTVKARRLIDLDE